MPELADKIPFSRLNPSALGLQQAAQLLSKVGGQPLSESLLQADVEDGAPQNPDGTLNLIHYAAWLVQELACGE